MRPTKLAIVERLLEQGPVLLCMDATKSGVIVPERLATQQVVTLRIGYDLSPPIHDMLLTYESFSGVLNFSGRSVHCTIPWSAVYIAHVEGKPDMEVWPDDAPDGLEFATNKKPSRGHLRLVP